ncbi:MAG: hypothetical protein EBX40_00500 [Gammaproteobacteria bacterium]|nr:hypothetical protein [Gammaproteobacteria bacterium]
MLRFLLLSVLTACTFFSCRLIKHVNNRTTTDSVASVQSVQLHVDRHDSVHAVDLRYDTAVGVSGSTATVTVPDSALDNGVEVKSGNATVTGYRDSKGKVHLKANCDSLTFVISNLRKQLLYKATSMAATSVQETSNNRSTATVAEETTVKQSLFPWWAFYLGCLAGAALLFLVHLIKTHIL